MTLKQRKWLTAYIETGNATEAARQAGYTGTDASLAQIGYENLRKLEIPVRDLMDRRGLTVVHLLKSLEAGLNATMTVTAKSEGKISDERTYPDYATRFQYLEMAFRLRGMFPRETMSEALPEALALLRHTLGVPTE
jgi:hypothetical protein